MNGLTVYNICVIANHMGVPRCTCHADSVILVNKEQTEENNGVDEQIW